VPGTAADDQKKSIAEVNDGRPGIPAPAGGVVRRHLEAQDLNEEVNICS